MESHVLQAPRRAGPAPSTHSFGRPGQPVEIASVSVLLASQQASYITGEIYGVTGGMAGVA